MTIDDLKQRIQEEVTQTSQEMLQNVMFSFKRRRDEYLS